MSQKEDKRKIVSSERLLHMKKMREALAKKNEEKKLAKLAPTKTEVEEKHEKVEEEKEVEEEEEVEEIETPVRKRRVVPKGNSYSLEEEIRGYVEQALPVEMRKENRKKQKWEIRKQEIKNEILQSINQVKPPDVSTPATPKPQKTGLFELKDLFYHH